MKFSQEDPTDAQLVKSYDDHAVVIQTGTSTELTTLCQPFILTAEKCDLHTQLNPIANLAEDDIAYFKSHDIEIVILGQTDVTRISPQIIVQLAKQAIGLEQMPIGAACRTYNLLVSEGRRVALYIDFS
jgi:uncharacterized protein